MSRTSRIATISAAVLSSAGFGRNGSPSWVLAGEES